MKHRTIFIPMLMPTLSDAAAAHLIDILEQLLGIAQHHYGDQAHRWHRRQRSLDSRPPLGVASHDDLR